MNINIFKSKPSIRYFVIPYIYINKGGNISNGYITATNDKGNRVSKDFVKDFLLKQNEETIAYGLTVFNPIEVTKKEYNLHYEALKL